jgi:hypothetical protein
MGNAKSVDCRRNPARPRNSALKILLITNKIENGKKRKREGL